ncbi:MAG: TRAM domain-containing protein [Nitrospirales bacterium]|nr:TRAM domain-containing protein [Nitrospira sp.]MDR4499916.1 TRAM domain-containing protein [Nitrospirales bacterium]
MILHTIFLVVGIVSGAGIGLSVGDESVLSLLAGAGLGAIISGSVILLENRLVEVPLPLSVWGGVGFGLGLLVSGLFVYLSGLMLASSTVLGRVGGLIALLTVPYAGLIVGMRYGSEAMVAIHTDESGAGSQQEKSEADVTLKLLDTSVIIDGRIADLCETGFIEGTLVVPQFILLELQHISDSSDSLKRARGRRGLDILNGMQKMTNIKIDIIEDDFPHVKEVDTKLVELAKKIEAKILTNDLNLNKVAGLQGVKVLNINELCNALKPVVLPGETLRVFVLKEGKEAGQGIAYLDDGTMVVVDHAKRAIGKNVDVLVTSVLQTSAGRMIFTRLKEESEREELSFARV